jgi:glycosyltransferase involved in cell wall biosynthesis
MSDKRIGFFTDGPAFDGATPDRQALGGSETALVQAARSLTIQGHRVTVFNNTPVTGLFDGVQYRPKKDYVRMVHDYFDVFIVSRFFGFFHVPINAGLRVLWNHDTLDHPDALRQVLSRIDLMLVLSDYHRNNYLTRVPEAANFTQVTRNGLDLKLIDRSIAGKKKNPQKVIYVSRPERGLGPLLENIWPRLKEARPDLTLHLCGYKVDTNDLAPGLSNYYQRLHRLAQESPDVIDLGPLPKREYYRHMAESELMLYPCTFPEISCIAALEAQACRTPVITTDAYALSETVGPAECKIMGRPGTESYNREYIGRTLDLLNNPGLIESVRINGRRHVETTYTWPNITREWNRMFDLFLNSIRSQNRQIEGVAYGSMV